MEQDPASSLLLEPPLVPSILNHEDMSNIPKLVGDLSSESFNTFFSCASDLSSSDSSASGGTFGPGKPSDDFSTGLDARDIPQSDSTSSLHALDLLDEPGHHELEENTDTQTIEYLLPVSESLLPTPSFAPPSPLSFVSSTLSVSPHFICRRDLSKRQSLTEIHKDSFLGMIASSDNALPDGLAWIKDLTIELLIDQEGFRSSRPTFRYAGYSSRIRLLDSGSRRIDGAVVDFMPVRREILNFHYAPLDGLPVLRRVVVKGEDSRDYISRQASLALKQNGVYTVHGTETSSFSSEHANLHSDLFKVKWKFDYLVGDRKGRLPIEGEKTLTPLTFSCSPALLHPLQGKKIKLMQIVKKTVSTKLIAVKLEPPVLRTVPPLSPTSPLTKSVKANTSESAVSYVKSRMWNLHRRAQSHVHTMQMPENVDIQSGNEGEDAMAAQRRRRASSAGERSRGLDDSGMQAYKHIADPSLLSELVSNVKVDSCVQRPSLSPAPRTRPRNLRI